MGGQVWRGGPGQESGPAVVAYLSMPTAPEAVVGQGLDELVWQSMKQSERGREKESV